MKRFLSVVLFSLALPITAASTGCAPRTVALQPERAPSITVIGEGEATADPDLGTVRLGVEERAPAADAAMRQANARMSAVMEAVKGKGVQGKDLQTTDLSMYFERNSPQYPMPEPRPVTPDKDRVEAEVMPVAPGSSGEYVVRNTVIVSVRDLDKLGEVIGAAMEAGANHLHGFELTIDDPSKLHEQARARAVQHAMKKAQQLAKEAGIKLGRVIEVTEVGGSSGPVPMMANMKMQDESSVPVEQGQLSLTQQVQVVFALQD